MKIVVNNQYTYETDKRVRIGSKVVLPSPTWLSDVAGATWEGTVTSLTSNYDGYCSSVVRVKKF